MLGDPLVPLGQLRADLLSSTGPRRLFADDLDGYSLHLAELVATAEKALAGVRSVTQKPSGLSLAEEAESARSMLSAAGIATRIDMACVYGGSLLAIVLREAVTNVVRHAHVGSCEIETSLSKGFVRLKVCNDGARADSSMSTGLTGPAGPVGSAISGDGSLAEAAGRHGTGLANLKERLEEAAGRLTVLRAGDRFILIAESPATPAEEHTGDTLAAV